MALFRLKKDTEKEKPKPEKVSVLKREAIEKKSVEVGDALRAPLGYDKDIASVLLHPRVTEKATVESERGVYVFNVSPRATKKNVKEAIEWLYKVSPRKINIVSVPLKNVRVRDGRNLFGKKRGGKKAYVYVKKGDSIDIV
ncbi:50S ribosomal protein L23 [Candidatus Kaiserbacteria bacterium]|nr:50S ribosomal protein L23 [Candidatus Kaiserbacteria bacterium]